MTFSLKDYRIIEEIGRGGFGSIYRARQESLGREVAIKRLSPQCTQNSDEIVRFRREAETMAALKHDTIIGVFDYSFHNGSYYIVMEYIAGMALDAAIERGMPRGCALFTLEKVTSALVYAHAESVTHRDVKPANILLGRNGQVKLADFGLALLTRGAASDEESGSVIGTINYMAPEALASPRDVDSRVDSFSVGCILYHVLSGTLPFAGSSFGETSHRILNEEPKPLDVRDAPRELSGITMRCLRKDREKRPSMKEIHDVLATSLEGCYRELHEELISFVRNEGGTDRNDGPAPEPRTEAPPTSRLRPRVLSPILAGFGACVLFLGALVLFHSLSGDQKSRTATLPGLPPLSSTAEVESAGDALPGGTPGTIARDAPAPLAGTAIDMKIGTLLLRGLAADDTVLVNDTQVVPARAGKDARLDIEPGFYKVAIKGSGRHPIVKETEILPYQRLVIDVRDERKKQ